MIPIEPTERFRSGLKSRVGTADDSLFQASKLGGTAEANFAVAVVPRAPGAKERGSLRITSRVCAMASGGG